MKRVVSTDKAPAAIGPYSQAIWMGDLLFLSGQIPLDPVTGQLVGKTSAEQAEQVLKNIGAHSGNPRALLSKCVENHCVLRGFGRFCGRERRVCSLVRDGAARRSFVEVCGLPKGAKVEIESLPRKGRIRPEDAIREEEETRK
jgi:2-iminobutanoate/2-iminopropanoate deaminase